MQSTFNYSYKKYYKIIEVARNLSRVKFDRNHPDYEYFENHHIIPESLGGSNKKKNMVLLTPEEHYICHSLLPDFCEGEARAKMLHAWNACNNSRNVNKGIKIIGSKKYGELKRDRAKSMSGINSPRARAVCQVNIKTGKIKEEFALIKDASFKTGINRDGIAQCCRSERKSTNNWLWFFKEDYSLEKALEIIFLINNPIPNIMSKEVCQVDIHTGKVVESFSSMNVASKKIHCRISGISQCCLGNRDYCKNYLWFYKEDYTLEKALNLIDKINSPKQRAVCQIDITTGDIKEIFKNIKEAGEKTSLNKVQIGECCRETKDLAQGFLWIFEEDLKDLGKRLKKARLKQLEQTKLVYRLDQNTFEILEEFQTIKEALQKYSGNISLCCKGEQELAGGELWCLAKNYSTKYASLG